MTDRAMLAALGLAALAGLGLARWLAMASPPVAGLPSPEVAAQWDARLRAERGVDVNTAGVAELERLPQIGPALAGRIIEDRAAHGPFKTLDDVGRVAGIGRKTLEALRDDLITGE